jgi:hypothetical protein
MNPITDKFVYILMADLSPEQEFCGVFDSEERLLEFLNSGSLFYVRDAYYIIKQELNYPFQKETIKKKL